MPLFSEQCGDIADGCVRATQTLNKPPSVCTRAHCFYANIFFNIANSMVNMFTVHVTITTTLSIHNYIYMHCVETGQQQQMPLRPGSE